MWKTKKKYKKDSPINRFKFAAHGFFFSTAISVAEPSTMLPLMMSFFSSGNVLIGLLSSLVRGGAVLMQLFMAYFAQSFKKVMKPLRWLFLFRFISWTSVGFSLFFLGDKNPSLTLWFIGTGLFLFSFFAGFGTILFHELLGKIFTNKYRGVTWGYRQFFMAVGGILSVFLTAYILHKYEKPYSFAFAFLVSSVFMGIGYIFLGTISEGKKEKTNKREKDFISFLANTLKLLKEDRILLVQIIVCFISFAYLLAFPFIVVQTKVELQMAGKALGSALPLLFGNVFGNVLWIRLSGRDKDRAIVRISFVFMIASLIISIFAKEIISFVSIYLLAGSAMDGFRLSFKNLVLNIAPEEKRPVYFAVQNNLTSLAMFLSIPGGWLLNFMPLEYLTVISIFFMVIGFLLSFRIK